MCFLGEHEAGGARERIEAAFGERLELIFAVAVGEHRETEEVQPVADRRVEGVQDTWMVAMAAAPDEQLFGLLASVAAEVAMEQVNHRPQMARFLDVDLEQVAQVVERRRRLAQMALLLDRGRLG